MKVVIYKSDSEGVTGVGNHNPLPVTTAFDSNISFNQASHVEAASGGSIIKTGTSGQSIYITDITISAEQAGDIWLKDGAGATVLQPVYLAANGNYTASFNTPIKVAASQNLLVQTDANIHISLQVNGYVA